MATFSKWPLFYVPANYSYIHSYVNVPTTASTAQWQWPLKCIPIAKITFQQRPVNLWLTTKQVFFGKGHKTWSVPCIGNLFSCFIVGCVTYLCATNSIFFKIKVCILKKNRCHVTPHLPIIAKSLKQPFSLSPRWPLQRSFTVLSSLLTRFTIFCLLIPYLFNICLFISCFLEGGEGGPESSCCSWQVSNLLKPLFVFSFVFVFAVFLSFSLFACFCRSPKLVYW